VLTGIPSERILETTKEVTNLTGDDRRKVGWTRHRAKQGAARDADCRSVEILAIPEGEAETDLDPVTAADGARKLTHSRIGRLRE
jgi:hypothetical protein